MEQIDLYGDLVHKDISIFLSKQIKMGLPDKVFW